MSSSGATISGEVEDIHYHLSVDGGRVHITFRGYTKCSKVVANAVAMVAKRYSNPGRVANDARPDASLHVEVDMPTEEEVLIGAESGILGALARDIEIIVHTAIRKVAEKKRV